MLWRLVGAPSHYVAVVSVRFSLKVKLKLKSFINQLLVYVILKKKSSFCYHTMSFPFQMVLKLNAQNLSNTLYLNATHVKDRNHSPVVQVLLSAPTAFVL